MAEGSPRKPWWRRWFGTRSERAASRFLKQLGYRVLARNYRCAFGEIDLVAIDGGCIVFIEVRSTEQPEIEAPAASVNDAKQRQLTRLALMFLKQYRLLGRAARFDVLALSWPTGQRWPTIKHYKHAFDCAGANNMFG